MFGNELRYVSSERKTYLNLLKQYRRPCFFENVDVNLTKQFIGKLISLYEEVWDELPEGSIFCELDVVTKEILSDINYEINQASKKANLDFTMIQNRLKSTSIKEWEAITSSHPIRC